MRLTALKNTLLKSLPIQSGNLSDKDKIAYKQGATIECQILSTQKNHYLIELQKPAKGLYNWYAYTPHWQPETLILPVPFYAQTDNFTQPDRTCNSSACAMAAKYLGAKITGDDDYLSRVLQLGDTTDHSVQTQVLHNLGVKSTWHTDLSFTDLDQQLAKKRPVVIGILHRGTDKNPTGGHMIVAIGQKPGGYIFHDPYGSLLDNYTTDVTNGKEVSYSISQLEARWLVEGANSGWGRIFP
ncbi:MAG: hypothetical protein DDT31_01051 [Syntrophomonadaceae bacterium]|nr:hypothetical protein [Bacillota bacterium]